MEQEQTQVDLGKLSIISHSHFDGLYDRPLSCFGCGIGWFCFALGFIFPFLWYVATALYIGKFHLKDPRERAGLAASAIAAMVFTAALMITFLVLILTPVKSPNN